jgi:hypothetical protein
MKRVCATAVLALTLAFAARGEFSAQASKLKSATATFRCTGVAVSFVNPPNQCQNGDAIAGDSLGPYVGGPTGGNNVADGAYIDGGGDVYLVLQQESGRAVFFGFTPPSPGDLRTFSSIWSFRVRFSQCGAYDANNHTISLSNVPLNQTVNGWCDWNFTDTSDTADTYLWTVRFDPVHYPGTSYVSVTRTGLAAWTIEADAPTGALAELIASTTSGKSVTYGEGFYPMPFSVSITQP